MPQPSGQIPLTLEQQPPNIRPSMPPTASHCGIVSIKILPKIAIILEEAGRSSSMPYISAFSKDGAALIILGTMALPSEAEACRSRRVERRRETGMGLGWVVLLELALRALAISDHARLCVAGQCEGSSRAAF